MFYQYEHCTKYMVSCTCERNVKKEHCTSYIKVLPNSHVLPEILLDAKKFRASNFREKFHAGHFSALIPTIHEGSVLDILDNHLPFSYSVIFNPPFKLVERQPLVSVDKNFRLDIFFTMDNSHYRLIFHLDKSRRKKISEILGKRIPKIPKFGLKKCYNVRKI